jgi:hypothetical protein
LLCCVEFVAEVLLLLVREHRASVVEDWRECDVLRELERRVKFSCERRGRWVVDGWGQQSREERRLDNMLLY